MTAHSNQDHVAPAIEEIVVEPPGVPIDFPSGGPMDFPGAVPAEIPGEGPVETPGGGPIGVDPSWIGGGFDVNPLVDAGPLLSPRDRVLLSERRPLFPADGVRPWSRGSWQTDGTPVSPVHDSPLAPLGSDVGGPVPTPEPASAFCVGLALAFILRRRRH
jgi:hypothetical protein